MKKTKTGFAVTFNQHLALKSRCVNLMRVSTNFIINKWSIDYLIWIACFLIKPKNITFQNIVFWITQLQTFLIENVISSLILTSTLHYTRAFVFICEITHVTSHMWSPHNPPSYSSGSAAAHKHLVPLALWHLTESHRSPIKYCNMRWRPTRGKCTNTMSPTEISVSSTQRILHPRLPI